MGHKLLLADDSITIQKVVELTLSEEDFDVTAVSDGEAALEAAGRVAPDIILADVFMPRMDGYELCGKVKQDPALRHVPVVLLAGTFENFDDVLAMKVGADDHLTKPFESAELIAMVKRLVERKAAPAQAAAPAPVFEAAPAASDDLWSVVDMQSGEQPLAEATAIMSEEDLWKRANLSEEHEAQSEETVVMFAPESDTPWAEDASVVEEADVFEVPEPEPFPEVSAEYDPAETTMMLSMDDLAPAYAAAEPEPLQPAEVYEEEPQIVTFDSLHAAAAASDFAPRQAPAPEPARAAAPAQAAAAISPEMLREEVVRAVRDMLDDRLKDALASVSRDLIEQVLWEVVPDIAEEIISREVEKLTAGIS